MNVNTGDGSNANLPMLNSRLHTRKFQRFDFPLPVEFSVNSDNAGIVHQGVIVNISLMGMAAFFPQPLEEGQHITFKSTLPIACRTAAVRWLKKEDEGSYITGLKFLDWSYS